MILNKIEAENKEDSNSNLLISWEALDIEIADYYQKLRKYNLHISESPLWTWYKKTPKILKEPLLIQKIKEINIPDQIREIEKIYEPSVNRKACFRPSPRMWDDTEDTSSYDELKEKQDFIIKAIIYKATSILGKKDKILKLCEEETNDLQNILDRLRSEIAELKKELSKYREIEDKRRTQIEELTRENKLIDHKPQKTLEEIQKEYDTLTKRFESLYDSWSILQIENKKISRLEKSLAEKDEISNSYKKSAYELGKKWEDGETELKEAYTKNTHLTNQINNLNIENAKISSELSNLKIKYQIVTTFTNPIKSIKSNIAKPFKTISNFFTYVFYLTLLIIAIYFFVWLFKKLNAIFKRKKKSLWKN